MKFTSYDDLYLAVNQEADDDRAADMIRSAISWKIVTWSEARKLAKQMHITSL